MGPNRRAQERERAAASRVEAFDRLADIRLQRLEILTAARPYLSLKEKAPPRGHPGEALPFRKRDCRPVVVAALYQKPTKLGIHIYDGCQLGLTINLGPSICL